MVTYILVLKYVDEDVFIEKEELISQYSNFPDRKKNLFFEKSSQWANAVLKGGASTNKFISTDKEKQTINLYQDKRGGRQYTYPMKKLRRTVLSSATAEYPTAYVVKKEMMSWMILQLEVSDMRKSDDFETRHNATLSETGKYLAATAYRLALENDNDKFYQTLVNKLSALVDNIKSIEVEKDDKRSFLTLFLKFRDGMELPARYLSDGTLRFLALAVLVQDNKSGNLICLEEPENGIHPAKIITVINLLRDIAFDTKSKEIDLLNENLLRQVIINTHSPLVVREVPESNVLVAEIKEYFDEKYDTKYKAAIFRPLNNTWRTNCIPEFYDYKVRALNLGTLLAYLKGENEENEVKTKEKKVKERQDVKENLKLF